MTVRVDRAAGSAREPWVLRALTGAILIVALAAAAPTPRAAAGGERLTGEELIALLQAGRVALTGATITTTLDFRSFQTVPHTLSCRDCVFEGGIRGGDVVFTGPLDLAGAQIAGPVVLSRATFRAPVVFGPTAGDPGSVSFAAGADFSYARFADVASFAQASFERAADFSGSRFERDSVLAGASFAAGAVFDRAVFAGHSDVRDATFLGPASFAAAEFAARADFSDAFFAADADFEAVRFGADAVFLDAYFTHPRGADAEATFARVNAEGDLVFDLAEFHALPNFRRAVAGGEFSFADAKLADGRDAIFEHVTADQLAMDVDTALNRVQSSDRQRVLALIEAGAKARGELGVANDARYELEVLRSRDDPWYGRIPNVVLYRTVAGYLVRPLNPLLALVVVVALVAFARSLGGARIRGISRYGLRNAGRYVHAFALIVSTAGSSHRHGSEQAPSAADDGSPRRPRRAAGQRLRSGAVLYMHELLDTFALILPGGKAEERRGRRVETLVYRVLLVCAAIGLANSNPTLREMFDAVVS